MTEEQKTAALRDFIPSGAGLSVVSSNDGSTEFSNEGKISGVWVVFYYKSENCFISQKIDRVEIDSLCCELDRIDENLISKVRETYAIK